MYYSTKIVDGFSTCFRQWKADSHCRFLHGYALKFKLTFKAETLDVRNWVVDFGFLRDKYDDNMTFKMFFDHYFDHTTIVAKDDPKYIQFIEMGHSGMIDLRIINNVGCEAFAELVFKALKDKIPSHVKLDRVECIENENNSAIYVGQ